MKKMYDVVSAFIIVRNEEKTIEGTLRSLLFQKYPIREIVVINDGSTDNTRNIVEGYQGATYLVKIVDLPEHEESYVGRWELGRSINHGLREIKRGGVPDWILQMGADHVLPDDYVSELVNRMTDEIRISSGTYKDVNLNIDTPIGSGKLIDARLWDKVNGMVYPEKYGYENWIDYRFRMEGFKVSRNDDLVTDCRPVRMNKTKARNWGKSTYALGGITLFALLKALSLRRHGISYLRGYFSRKDTSQHEDVARYVGDMQYDKAKKQGLSILDKWRKGLLRG